MASKIDWRWLTSLRAEVMKVGILIPAAAVAMRSLGVKYSPGEKEEGGGDEVGLFAG